ncbi:anti-sigma factor [Pseudophaeobacter sp. A-200-2]|uniref:anti-sigma factor family protein n=1 Tax=Pseudophaeobacter sp. A-200-2 TaxID=3098145 RepID=UPI0034D43E07
MTTHPDTPLSDDELLAYHHGELDEAARVALTERIAADPTAQTRLADWAQQDEELRILFPEPEEPTPEALTDILRRPAPATAPRSPFRAPARVAAMVGLLTLGGLGGWIGRGALAPMTSGNDLAQAALKAHDTYVVEVVHPVEVPASQRDHLESWISKRVGAPLVPPDLAASGFALMGGRVLPSEDGTAGLFMYENDAGTRITLYIAPQHSGGDSAFRYAGEGATQGLYWQDGPLGYAVVGQMPRDHLRTLAEKAYDQLL